jgi:hypothetical protein
LPIPRAADGVYLCLHAPQTVYQELDVDAEMQNGLLPGLLALSGKFVPTVRSVAQKTVDSARRFVESTPAYLEERLQSPAKHAPSAASTTEGVRGEAGARCRQTLGRSQKDVCGFPCCLLQVWPPCQGSTPLDPKVGKGKELLSCDMQGTWCQSRNYGMGSVHDICLFV